MKKIIDKPNFKKNIKRGRDFEKEEKAQWEDVDAIEIKNEKKVTWNNKQGEELKEKKGRIDIRIEERDDYISIIEIKSTNWDTMKPHRIRPNALRHARQVFNYIQKEVFENEREVCAGVIYEHEPTSQTVKDEVENILFERGFQCVWRNTKIF